MQGSRGQQEGSIRTGWAAPVDRELFPPQLSPRHRARCRRDCAEEEKPPDRPGEEQTIQGGTAGLRGLRCRVEAGRPAAPGRGETGLGEARGDGRRRGPWAGAEAGEHGTRLSNRPRSIVRMGRCGNRLVPRRARDQILGTARCLPLTRPSTRREATISCSPLKANAIPISSYAPEIVAKSGEARFHADLTARARDPEGSRRADLLDRFSRSRRADSQSRESAVPSGRAGAGTIA